MTTDTTTAAQIKDHDRELERAIRDALVLIVGKRTAGQAIRHARRRTHGARQRSRVRRVGHMAGYGALLAYIWYERRTPKHATP
jgi:type VI protein secretion system component VasF